MGVKWKDVPISEVFPSMDEANMERIHVNKVPLFSRHVGLTKNQIETICWTIFTPTLYTIIET